MLPLHRTLLAAPLFFSFACNVTVGGSATEGTTTEDPSTSSASQTTNPPTTNPPTTDTPTTTGESASSGTSGETDPTTSGGTTGGTTTSEGTTTDGTTSGGATVCMATSECDDGQFCWAPFVMDTPTEEEFVCQPACVDDMGAGGNSEMAWCIDDGACCTEGSTCDETGYCVPAAGETTTGDTEGSTGGTGESTAGDTGESTAGESTAGDTGTTGGLMQPLILLSGFEVFGDCMPIVPEDPISAKWTATFDNTLGMADYTATVSSATLTYSPGMNEFVQDITVAPTTSGVVAAGKTVMKAQSKTKALMNLPMDCQQCGKQVALEILFDVGGEPVLATADAIMTCGL